MIPFGVHSDTSNLWSKWHTGELKDILKCEPQARYRLSRYLTSLTSLVCSYCSSVGLFSKTSRRKERIGGEGWGTAPSVGIVSGIVISVIQYLQAAMGMITEVFVTLNLPKRQQ